MCHERMELQLVGQGAGNLCWRLTKGPFVILERGHVHHKLVSCCNLGTTTKADSRCPGVRCQSRIPCASLSSSGRLSLIASALPSGARVVTLTHQLRSPSFKVVAQGDLLMSWGSATVFYHDHVKK